MQHIERVLSAPSNGFLEIETDSVSVDVIVEPRSNVHVTLVSENGDDPVVTEAIEKANLRGSTLKLYGPTYRSGRGGNITVGFNAGVIVGGVQYGNGNVQHNSFGRGSRSQSVTSIGGLHATVRIPNRMDFDFSGSSADLEVHGSLERTSVKVGSGDVRLFETGALDVNSGSGDVLVDRVHGDASIHAASGDVAIDFVAGVGQISTASGDVSVGELRHGGKVDTASGDIKIDAAGGRLRAMAASGDIRVPDSHLVSASTMSGRVRRR